MWFQRHSLAWLKKKKNDRWNTEGRQERRHRKKGKQEGREEGEKSKERRVKERGTKEKVRQLVVGRNASWYLFM